MTEKHCSTAPKPARTTRSSRHEREGISYPFITHAEAVINGVSYDGPYRLAGAALLAGGGRRFDLGRSLFLSAELMATAAFASPTLEGEPGARIRATNAALHGIAGIGLELR